MGDSTKEPRGSQTDKQTSSALSGGHRGDAGMVLVSSVLGFQVGSVSVDHAAELVRAGVAVRAGRRLVFSLGLRTIGRPARPVNRAPKSAGMRQSAVAGVLTAVHQAGIACQI